MQIVNASEDVQATIPDEHTRVTNLLQMCATTDADFCTKKSAIEDTEDDNTGPLYNFERAVARLIAPACPVAKRRNKRPAAHISSSDTVPQPSLKSGIGSTGVQLRWYNKADHAKLTPKQKKELSEYLKQNPSAIPDDQRANGPARKKAKKSKNNDKADGKLTRRIMAVLASVAKNSAAPPAPAAIGSVETESAADAQPPVSLSALLKRAEANLG